MGRTKKESEHSSNLIKALKFIALSGATYCLIRNGWITAVTDTICMGNPIDEDLEAKAHIKNLCQSLIKAQGHTSITQLNLTKLFVNNGDFQVYIDCAENVEHVKADDIKMELNNNFLTALATVLPVCSAFGEHIAMKTILLYGQSLYATNRFMLVEYWHGNTFFEKGLAMPKKFCDLVIKSKKEVLGIGYSNNSVTVIFKDASWIMGRISNELWMNAEAILSNEAINPIPISEEFQKAARMVPAFSDTGLVWSLNGCLQSHQDEAQGASYPVPNLPDGGCYGVKEIDFLIKNAKQISMENPKMLYFFGDSLRGVISSRG